MFWYYGELDMLNGSYVCNKFKFYRLDCIVYVPFTACNITDCPRGSRCKIYEPTGEPFCEPSCDLDNGGCADNETCSLRNVTCARAPCPPVVECSSE